MSRRTDQIASLIRRAVQSRLSRGLNDPRVRGMISVTQVTVAADLSEAVILISVMPAKHAQLTLRGLQSAATHLRGELGRTARLRHQPRLTFKLDDSMRHAAEAMAAIMQVSGTERPSPDQTQTEDSGS
ncbi:MAG: 30S ribosome-binding factor RbfA [Planctomycetes bacterium]|nr:30S ribosome-binding factor RbfA [Planctomycetota bacterium]MCH8260629.1 30S ribosome-binding factor RbfA [Planctomycetota bacterium]